MGGSCIRRGAVQVMFVVLHGAFLQGHLQALSQRCDVWHLLVCKNLQTGGPHAQLVLTGAPQVEGLSMHWDNPACHCIGTIQLFP